MIEKLITEDVEHFYRVVCDHCGRTLGKEDAKHLHDDDTWCDDPQEAEEEAIVLGWFYTSDKHYCPKCWAHLLKQQKEKGAAR